MGDARLEFGNPADIAYARANSRQRDRTLRQPHGFEFGQHIPIVTDEELERWFSPDPDNPQVLTVPNRENRLPQYTLPVGAIMFNGWYGDEGTEEIGIIDEPTAVRILGVKRPPKEKGPAPSWRVRNDFPLGQEAPAYYVARVGKRFVGQPRSAEGHAR